MCKEPSKKEKKKQDLNTQLKVKKQQKTIV